MTLMIVEDNPEFRKMLVNIFSEYFSEIYETDNGEKAISNYDLYKPEWTFMDIGLKKLDGISAAEQIINKHPGAKIVIVSQYNNPRIINAALNAGAADYVTKDDISKLFKIIR